MYNVLDVSRFIINYTNENEVHYGISNLKLQKILYFVQAYFVISKGEHHPCFYETIEAWNFGPVVPEAYHEFKRYGSADIPTISYYFEFDEANIWDSRRIEYNDSIIKMEDKELIKAVVDEFLAYSATYLVELTHKQDPWKNAYSKGKNTEISLESLIEYFKYV